MIEFKLWENEIPFTTEGAETPNLLKFYPAPTHHKVPCIIVCPGGGYAGRARHEADPIAEYFVSRGLHAAVVEYRVKPNVHPAPLADAQRAVKIIRAKAKDLYVDPDKIITLGFSAGGHLAASTAVFDDVDVGIKDEYSDIPANVNAAILCYPVIDVDSEIGHTGSGKNLLGDRYEAEKGDFCLQHKVSDKTPPIFIWHTSNDSVVNVRNSLEFGAELRKHNIKFEMHIFPDGPHGLGLALHKEDASKWASLAADWVIRNI